VNANKVKIAKRAAAQSLSWANDDDSGAVAAKALRIVVVERAFRLGDVPAPTADDDDSLDSMIRKKVTPRDDFGAGLGTALAALLDPASVVDKATPHLDRPDGVVVFKFARPGDAQDAIKAWDGASFRGATLKAFFWDGVTDYAKAPAGDEAAAADAEDERIDAFGDWIEDQGELPPELQLRVEGA